MALIFMAVFRDKSLTVTIKLILCVLVEKGKLLSYLQKQN